MARLHRRNFFPAFSLSLILWLFLAVIIKFLDPKTTLIFSKTEIPIALITFFVVVFLALFITSALLFASTRRGLFLAVFVSLALFLLLEKLGQWWNLALLFIFYLFLEIFFSKKNHKTEIPKL